MWQAITSRIYGKPRSMDWKTLAGDCGVYAVIDARHPPEEFDYVTRRQKEILFPLLRRLLHGDERTILDFGCGPGRFTGDLAELINGKAVGYDVTSRLLELAPVHPSVEYVHSADFLTSDIPQFDVIWVCLVFGGIAERELAPIAAKLTQALREDGLLFLVEATAPAPVIGAWSIRPREQLRSLFPSLRLDHVGAYYDAGQEISVLAGRR
jgi:SAM-dependent methyltransferase